MEQGSQFAGGEIFVDEHQVFDKMPVRVQPVFPSENLNSDDMIKMAEEKIEKMNRDRVLIVQKLKERMNDRSTMERTKYYDDDYVTTLKRHRERLDVLHLSLDKLSFVNNAYKGESMNSCLSVGEVDKQKLCFLMVHGCKNMADERKLLREVNASQGKDGGMTLDDLHVPIQHLLRPVSFNYPRYKKTDGDVARPQAIMKAINQHEMTREIAISNAVVNGKLWNSLGSKKAIEAELQALNNSLVEPRRKQVKRKAKLRKVEKSISSLEKRLKNMNCKKDEINNNIFKLKKQTK